MHQVAYKTRVDGQFFLFLYAADGSGGQWKEWLRLSVDLLVQQMGGTDMPLSLSLSLSLSPSLHHQTPAFHKTSDWETPKWRFNSSKGIVCLMWMFRNRIKRDVVSPDGRVKWWWVQLSFRNVYIWHLLAMFVVVVVVVVVFYP